LKIITTPLVASACSNVFPVLIEAIYNILGTFNADPDIEANFLF